MHLFSRIFCLLCLCPALLIASPEAKAIGAIRALSAAVSSSAQKEAGDTQTPESHTDTSQEVDSVSYSIGSEQETLTVTFPARSKNELIEIEATDAHTLVLYMDSKGIGADYSVYALGSAAVSPEEYSQFREDLLDTSFEHEETGGYHLHQLEVEEVDGVLHRWQTVSFSPAALRSGQEAADFTARCHLILSKHHLFFLMVSSASDAMRPGSPVGQKADHFLKSWSLR